MFFICKSNLGLKSNQMTITEIHVEVELVKFLVVKIITKDVSNACHIFHVKKQNIDNNTFIVVDIYLL